MGSTSTRWLRAVGAVVVCFLAIALPGGISSDSNYSADTDTSMSASAFDYLFVLRDAVWWLDSADASTLFSNSACTTPAGTTSGSVVRCWVDKRAPSNAVTTTGGGAEVGPTAIGTETPLRFTSGSMLEGPDLFGGTVTDLNLFLVLRENVRVQNRIFNLNGSDTINEISAHAAWSNGRWYLDLGDNSPSRSQSTSGVTAVGEDVLLVAWMDSAADTSGFYVNASATFLSFSTATTPTTGGLRLGDDVLPVTSHDIAEMIVYKKRLSSAEETAVAQYLELKWGL